jgi:hypothetical protein
MNKIYHPYWLWEDWINGMWRKESKEYEEGNMSNIIQFTGDHIEYGKAMRRVIDEWPTGCENNLSNVSINRKAWLGHAACCIQFGYPEYLVRKAWFELTDEQRDLANNEARKAIKIWEQRQRLKPTLQGGKIDAIQMEFQMQHQ